MSASHENDSPVNDSTVNDSPEDLTILPATTEPYHIAYEDDVLLVVNKPAHLLTVPGRHPQNQDCLIRRVQREFYNAEVVHRLDYDTSGLVILPLTKRVLSDISKQFQARTVQKHYIAIVAGKVAKARGTIELPIAADEANRPLYKICHATGKPAVTRYQLLSYDSATHQSRVQLEPITGRSHQLRLHMLALGHAILGDTLYATADIAAKSSRLMLHAQYIRFNHPLNGEVLAFSEPAPF
ncbi:pseudouridine synthase [Rheinheimera baltica]|uniref:Pseudouridine synthase n=1 Tax=Rheinheimera baltica TaxID=67576 RepID=A0ABT9HU18_9GAMM|nr:pseudouridine synthase [Rheinheimera baltica]MDP5134622.1 pseudouridine synthase [Rheinheimera baltica]MDP5141619.1 pseudouridine synthase [Rheinheimera baltica]MDP5189934.1 pseudouridine synthase [Rheinheimera baltica]